MIFRINKSPRADISTELNDVSDQALKDEMIEIAFQIRMGKKISHVRDRVYAVASEASARVLKMRPYPVQIQAAQALSARNVVQMATGEGKSLTSTLPLILYSLKGKGAHLATANDYLAARDAEEFRPLFGFFGLTVGCVTAESSDEERRNAYACDITYGTCTEFGFDFLRDRIKLAARRKGVGDVARNRPVMRGLHFLLADEADSLLIDDANTPLIIGAQGYSNEQRDQERRWAAEHCDQLKEKIDFEYDLRSKSVRLSQKGRGKVLFAARSASLRSSNSHNLYAAMEKAILVSRDFVRDKQYVVSNGEVIIVNENTGRLGYGTKWQDGLQQAVEASEDVEITPPNSHAAKITMQTLVLSYSSFAGLTGTATPSKSEFRRVYKLRCVEIPTNKPCQRIQYPDLVFPNAEQKWNAICQEIDSLQKQGRAILVATRSISDSELVSRKLKQMRIEHQVLNANNHEVEAAIVKDAGRPQCVTVATNMAGRGTDISIHSDVKESSGLHVILTELNDSARIDRQVIGRCARQGDPGSYRRYFSPDDKIIELGFGVEMASRVRSQTGSTKRLCIRAQSRLEARNLGNRKTMLYYEKRELRSLWQIGLDPLVETAD